MVSDDKTQITLLMGRDALSRKAEKVLTGQKYNKLLRAVLKIPLGLRKKRCINQTFSGGLLNKQCFGLVFMMY